MSAERIMLPRLAVCPDNDQITPSSFSIIGRARFRLAAMEKKVVLTRSAGGTLRLL